MAGYSTSRGLDLVRYLPDGAEDTDFQNWNNGGIVATASGFYVQTAATGSAYTAGDYVLMNPISVEVSNLDGQDTDYLSAQAAPLSPLPSGEGEDEGGLTVYAASATDINNVIAAAAVSPVAYTSWTHYDYETKANATLGYAVGDLMSTDVYSSIYASPPVYNETIYGYSSMGYENRVVDPTGTITRQVFSPLGLVASTWVGTDDSGATDSDPTGGRTGAITWYGNNMLEVSANVYDDGAAGGDGNVTSQTEYVDADSADNRTTLFGYDWRDEQLWTMVNDLTPDPNNPGSTRKTYTFNTLDNLGDVTNVTRYYDLANTEGLPDNAPNSGDPVIGRAGAAFDNLGDQYQSISYNETGTTAIISNTWFDGDGNVIRTQAGGTQEWAETLYDGLGDAVNTYDGVGGGSDYSDFASSLGQINVNSDQTVLTQTADEYDDAGDQTFETDYNRLPGETATAR